MAVEKTLSERLAEFVIDLDYDDLPHQVIEQAKRVTLDQIGCQLIGSTLEWNKKPYNFIRDLEGRPESTIVNYGTKALVHDAAYVNSTFGQGAELDDYNDQGGGHAGAICIPVALSLCEKNRLGGKEFLTAVVIGNQVQWSLARLMYPGLVARGFHVHSVIGVFTAAAITGRLLGLKVDQLVSALGIAGSHAGGTMEHDQSGGEAKRVASGVAARGGMESAMLAGYGLTGPKSILEGERGICPLFAGQCKTERFTLDKEWGILHQIFKTYPCVGTIQSSIDVLSKLITHHSIKSEQVAKIEVALGESSLRHGATIVEPQDTCSSQYSLAYSLAIRLLKGSNDLELYMDPHLWRNPQVLSLAHKVEACADPDMLEEKRFASRMRVTLKDGITLEGYLENPRGTPANPLTKEELTEKFQKLASWALPLPQVEKIIHMVEELDQLDDISQIVPLLVRHEGG